MRKGQFQIIQGMVDKVSIIRSEEYDHADHGKQGFIYGFQVIDGLCGHICLMRSVTLKTSEVNGRNNDYITPPGGGQTKITQKCIDKKVISAILVRRRW